MTKYHYGNIKFTTKERLERPYIDDIERLLVITLKKYLTEYLQPFKPEDVFIRISVYNQDV